MIHVQEYLKTHSLAQLKAEHGVKSSAKAAEYMFSLNYDQIESKPSPLVNQCRGLILATNPTKGLRHDQIDGDEPVRETYVMARPFDRFFNYGDSNASQIAMNDTGTIFFEKLDGTLCILYFNPELEEWHVATRAVPMADKPITGWEDLTFRKLFERALYESLLSYGSIGSKVNPEVCFQRWTRLLDQSKTYMFELTTPLNRIVVDYKKFSVWLIGIRDTQTGQETSLMDVSDNFDLRTLYGVSTCLFHELSNTAELMAFVGSKPPFEQEGVVVCDKNFNRVKVKSLAYMAYNRLRDSTANSPRAIMELILTEKLDDVLPVMESYIHSKAIQMQEGLRKLVHKVDAQYAEILTGMAGTENPRKEFAIGVQTRKAWMGPMMDRYLGKCSDFSDWVQKRKNADGSWPDSFLDTVIEESAKLL